MYEREVLFVIHLYQNNGYNIVLDVNSGAVHVVDQAAYDVIGVLEDKDYPRMLEDALPLGSAFVCVTPDNPRALPAHKLARAIRWTGQDLLGCSACVNPVVARDFEDAIRRARELADHDGLICAFGSLYSVAALK